MSKYEKSIGSHDLGEAQTLSTKSSASFHDSDLRFTVETIDNLAMVVDLTRFRDGDAKKDIMGFPNLILELLSPIKSHLGRSRRTENAVNQWLAKSIIPLFKAVSYMKRVTGMAPERIDDFQDAHGVLIKDYLMQAGGKAETSRGYYGTIYALLISARSKSAPPLRWPTFDISREIKVHSDVDPRAVKIMYHTCKRVVERAELAFQRGRDLLAQGVDPRDTGPTKLFQKGRKGGLKNLAWRNPANLAVLQRIMIRDRILSLGQIDRTTITSVHNFMSDGGAGGSGTTWSELVSAIVPSILEIGALVILVSMETGWIDAVWGVDLEDEWFTLRRGHDIMSLKKTDSIVLHSTRPKTYGRVAAVGLAGSKFRSFQLIRALVDRTEFLRQCLRERLQLLEAQEKKVAIAAEIKKIKQRLRSPWLYYNSKGNGIDAVALGDGGSVNYALSFLKAKAIEALSSEQKHDDTLITGINALKWSDCRDALATHIYDASGGNIFLVKQALDHNNVSTTRMYLRQRRQIRERFAAFRKVTNTILEEVKNGNSVDPTILFLSVNYRDFGEVDRERLKSFRTRLGMGCSNPTSPDSFLAPHHIEGTFCLVQRCVLCRHGIIFKDAYKDLAIRRADLVWLRSNTPPNRWLTSNLSWELEAIELVRDNIFTSQIEGFDSLARDRLDEIAAGRAYVFDDPEISGKLR